MSFSRVAFLWVALFSNLLSRAETPRDDEPTDADLQRVRTEIRSRRREQAPQVIFETSPVPLASAAIQMLAVTDISPLVLWEDFNGAGRVGIFGGSAKARSMMGHATLSPGGITTDLDLGYFASDNPLSAVFSQTGWAARARTIWERSGYGSFRGSFSQSVRSVTEPGLLPARELSLGTVSVSDSLDFDQGVSWLTRRADIHWHSTVKRGAFWLAGVEWEQKRIQQNFNESFFLNDPVRGDEREYRDQSHQLAARSSYTFQEAAQELKMKTRLGAVVKASVGTHESFATASRVVIKPLVRSEFQNWGGGVEAEQAIEWSNWFKTEARLTGLYTLLNDTRESSLASVQSGTLDKFTLAPEAKIAVRPERSTEVFVSTKVDYLPQEERALLRAPENVGLFRRQVMYQMGVRTALLVPTVDIGTRLFLVNEDANHWVNASDFSVGTFGKSRRIGAEFFASRSFTSWLTFEGSFIISKANLTESPVERNVLPFSPSREARASLVASHPSGFFGSASAKHEAGKVGSPDGFFAVPSFWRTDLAFGYKNKQLEVSLAALNVLSAAIWDRAIVRTSRLSGENSCPAGARPVSRDGSFTGCEDLLVSQAPPIQLLASASLAF